MQSFVNEPFLAKRAKFATWGTYIGIGALFLGLMATSRSVIVSYLLLMIGVVGASIGAYLTNKYVREPRPDQVLDQVLGDLDKRYAVYNYYLPAQQVIASHHGLTVILTRPQRGVISYRNGNWHHSAGWRKFLQFFGEPSLGKPDLALADDIDSVKSWITEVMPDEDVPVNGAVIFIDANAELDTAQAPVPTMLAEALYDHMKQGLKGQPVLTTAKQKELRRILDGVVGQGQGEEEEEEEG